MSKIGLFYGTTTGKTGDAAEAIQAEFGGDDVVEVKEISDCSPEDLAEYDYLIIGSSTWNTGELQDDWAAIYDDLDGIDFTGKKVAYFGTGDQIGYCGNFQDAMGILEEKISGKGGTTVGNWPKDKSYEGTITSKAYLRTPEGKLQKPRVFVGLALDEDNQSELTEGRIKTWVAQIKPEFGL
ncbi:MAG: flavodoxin [Okeania sp. SIO2F4]|uniref:flavodoxin n=1 Tax=Okeania sp. SIO2F4 TaxID=2607790 RepID=UPI00142A01DB|nr:flavodoxin [Okeania sp. SIO2F4]MDJ0516055.1 flavodoxin [Trichodesmium sp. MO_231.B1]NES02754.1 flavodoxin [Okeania sp. SIO2F4]